jgi:hypothetical protein
VDAVILAPPQAAAAAQDKATEVKNKYTSHQILMLIQALR